MKRSLLSLLSILCIGFSAFAQSYMFVPPGNPGILNSTIAGDTLPNGQRADSSRIYVLKRGIPYLLSAEIQFGDYHLQIVSESPDTSEFQARPLIIYNVEQGGSTLDQLFRIDGGGGSLTLKGLHISAQDILGNYVLRPFRINSDNVSVHIDDCIVEDVGQAGFRIQGDNSKIYVTNSIFNRMGQPNNPDNGRFIDNRGVPIDTIWVEQSVIYGVTSRIYRHSGSGSINYLHIDQNTIWGSGQHGFTLVNVGAMKFTNNIVFNGGFLGQTISGVPDYVLNLDTMSTGPTNYTVSHNNFFIEPDLIAALPADTNVRGDTIVPITSYSPAAQAAMDSAGTAGTALSQDIAFINEPPLPLQFITAIMTDTSTSGAFPTAQPWDFSDLTPDVNYSALGTGNINRYTVLHDFHYRNYEPSATAGDAGQPLGAYTTVVTGVEDLFTRQQIKLYPNPAVENIFLYEIQDIDLQKVIITNLMGQKVREVQLTARIPFMEIYVGDLSNGVYVLSLLEKGGKISSRKFVKQ
ncbi:MAG: T9SS type A sorting domain-containing protein [Bacteroidia bacterium]